MNRREVVILEDALADLEAGRNFYDSQEQGLGDYFFDVLLTDLESLSFYGGIHSTHCGYYRMPAKRFPFSIYYEIRAEVVLVIAVLDMRRNPAWSHIELKKRPLSE
ncbi:MAG: type II toxin-antitoxin system RelE/ParE family toxin [Candidatus Hydrogenedentes bacterium]|nr:type II toxin-antitoxin system RelE/ParE family toxin [Candidatus Hydrogenedentota bacterium]